MWRFNGADICLADLIRGAFIPSHLNSGAVKVLNSLDLDIHQGEFPVLPGSSGCGKSTLLNCIAGLQDPTDGQIFISGQNIT